MRSNLVSTVLILLVGATGLSGDGLGVVSISSPKSDETASVKIVRDVELPSSLRWARDVRFAGDGSVLLAAGRAGLVEFDLASRKSTVVVPGSGEGSFFHIARIAASGKTLVVASPFAALTWRDARGRLHEPFPFQFTVDIDLSGDRVALIGARFDEEGRWNPEKGVVWTGTLSSKLTDLSPLITTRKPTPADPINACHYLDLGVVRYLQDGSLLVVPGVQPGVYLYSADGRLKRTWDSTPLGFYDDCALSADEALLFAGHPIPRWKWLERHVVLDEVLDLPDGPALVTRSVERGATFWNLVRLDEPSEPERLPFRSTSTLSHLRGDVQGSEVVFLITEDGLLENPPAASPRVIKAEVTH